MTIWIAKALDVAQYFDNQIAWPLDEACDANRKARLWIERKVRQIEEKERQPRTAKAA